MGENLADVLNSIEVEDEAPVEVEDIDPEQAVVTKVKRWDGVLNDYFRMASFSFLRNVLIYFLHPTFVSLPSFDLSNAISVKEAIFALDYIDHDFYVFRDEETSEVSVVYKRNAGGVGLIQPEQWLP